MFLNITYQLHGNSITFTEDRIRTITCNGQCVKCHYLSKGKMSKMKYPLVLKDNQRNSENNIQSEICFKILKNYFKASLNN